MGGGRRRRRQGRGDLGQDKVPAEREEDRARGVARGARGRRLEARVVGGLDLARDHPVKVTRRRTAAKRAAKLRYAVNSVSNTSTFAGGRTAYERASTSMSTTR